MKKLLGLCLVLFFTGCATGNMTTTQQAMPEIIKVVEINGKTSGQIFDASQIWIAKSFVSANNVVQYADKSTGKIVGKGNIRFPCDGFISCGAFGNDRVNFTLRIDTSDNGAQLTISNVTRTPLTYVNGGPNTNIGREIPITISEHQKNISGQLKQIAENFEIEMKR